VACALGPEVAQQPVCRSHTWARILTRPFRNTTSLRWLSEARSHPTATKCLEWVQSKSQPARITKKIFTLKASPPWSTNMWTFTCTVQIFPLGRTSHWRLKSWKRRRFRASLRTMSRWKILLRRVLGMKLLSWIRTILLIVYTPHTGNQKEPSTN
jgi:hypothetical protein